MAVIHPQHGAGTVKAISEHAAEVLFNDTRRPVDPEASALMPAEPQAGLTALSLPLAELIRQTVDALADRLGLEKPDAAITELAPRWRGGKFVLHPHDPALATKELELEQFFHKIVMVRNNLRVLEQKINASETLTSAEKFDWLQYLTRSYGSLTTFNLLSRTRSRSFDGAGDAWPTAARAPRLFRQPQRLHEGHEVGEFPGRQRRLQGRRA